MRSDCRQVRDLVRQADLVQESRWRGVYLRLDSGWRLRRAAADGADGGDRGQDGDAARGASARVAVAENLCGVRGGRSSALGWRWSSPALSGWWAGRSATRKRPRSSVTCCPTARPAMRDFRPGTRFSPSTATRSNASPAWAIRSCGASLPAPPRRFRWKCSGTARRWRSRFRPETKPHAFWERSIPRKIGIAPAQEKLVVEKVTPYSPAAVAGIGPGDQVVALDGVKLYSDDPIFFHVKEHPYAPFATHGHPPGSLAGRGGDAGKAGESEDDAQGRAADRRRAGRLEKRCPAGAPESAGAGGRERAGDRGNAGGALHAAFDRRGRRSSAGRSGS